MGAKKHKELAKLLIIFSIILTTNFILYISTWTPINNEFEYGPILSWVNDPRTTITITWQWKDGGNAYVWVWNKTDKIIVNVSVEKLQPISVTIEGLSPGKEYNYIIGIYTEDGPINRTEVFSFRTAPADPQNFNVLLISDTQVFFSGLGMRAFRKLIESVSHEQYDFIIHVGDLVEYSKDIKMWALFLQEITKIAATHPFMAVLGNHDYNEYGGDLGENFFKYLALPNNERWYYFNYSIATFIALGVYDYKNFTFPSDERDMLLQALSFKDKWKIVYFHIPPRKVYVSMGNENIGKILLPIFSEKKPNLVITAHQHGYARYTDNGVKYVILSSASWFIPQFMYYSRDIENYSFEYGYALLQVTNNVLNFYFKNLNGDVLDNFEIAR